MISYHNIDIKSLTLEELENFLTDLGEKKYRAVQIFDYLYKKGLYSFSHMMRLPKATREILKSKCHIYKARIIEKKNAREDTTEKYLIRLEDNNLIETVLIRQAPRRNTLCVSTQVGCRYRCSFCASGLGGFVRDLRVSEITEQLLLIIKSLSADSIHNVVFMGMGEPLDNLPNVIRSIKIINSKHAFTIGMRKITVSTCGLADKIKELIGSAITPELSISLHAPDDDTRDMLMGINKKFNIKALIAAAREYTTKTKRLVTFEYILIKNVNDSPLQAQKLSLLLKNVPCKVNFIVYNEVKPLPYERPTALVLRNFCAVLKKNNTPFTVRASRGEAVDAACGQLRLRQGQKNV
ncbi:MAG: 23S rRNA (adenine(2503)-C(2))-methyltransferase RlmN [Candidatus Omnitrophota bacterium]